jgi:hypothetical protein
MYIIINKTQKTCIKYTGDFPTQGMNALLGRDERIVVINMYDNSVMLPTRLDEGVEWEEYPFPDGTFRGL